MCRVYMFVKMDNNVNWESFYNDFSDTWVSLLLMWGKCSFLNADERVEFLVFPQLSLKVNIPWLTHFMTACNSDFCRKKKANFY